MVVACQLRVELIRLALQKAVVVVEAALERPAVERPGSRALRHRREVPLARRERGVALLTQDLCERGRGTGQGASHVRKARVHVRDGPHPDSMVIAARQQTGARG